MKILALTLLIVCVVLEASRAASSPSVNEVTPSGRELSEACVPESLSATDLNQMEYTIGSERLEVQFKPFTVVPAACRVVYEIVGEATPYVTVNGGKLFIYSENAAVVDNYEVWSVLVRLKGTIGGEKQGSVTATSKFNLTLKNPCFDPTTVRIESPSKFSEIQSYTIFNPTQEFKIDEFSVVSAAKGVKASFCGKIEYTVAVNDAVIDKHSQPVAYNADTRSISMFSEDPDSGGVQFLTITAYFAKYPEIKSATATLTFNILVDQCRFQKLSATGLRLKDMIHFLSFMPSTQTFDLSQFVRTADSIDCGPLKIQFYGQTGLISQFFNHTDSSFTVLQMPMNGFKLIGHYEISYFIYLEKYDKIVLEGPKQKFTVAVYDPCSVLNTQFKPQLCFSKAIVKDRMPAWLTNVPDLVVIQFGQDYELQMGPPVDNFGEKIKVKVQLSAASNFVTFDVQKNSLIVKGAAMQLPMNPRYQVRIATQYTDIYAVEHYYERRIHFQLLHLNFPQVSPWEKVYFLGEPDGQFEIQLQQEQQAKLKLESFLISKTMRGEMRLGWSLPLDYVEGFDQTPNEQIALSANETSAGTVTVFDRKTRSIRKCFLRKSIEVAYLPQGDEAQKRLLSNARISDLKPTQMTISVDFDGIDGDTLDDFVSITFWRVDLFRQRGTTDLVQAVGSSIVVPASLFTSNQSTVRIDTLIIVLAVFSAMIGLASIAIAVLGGSVTSVWVCLNAFQLLAFSALIRIPSTPVASYLLKRLLDMVRLNIMEDLIDIDQQETQTYHSLMSRSSLYNDLFFQSLGFSPWIFQNLAPSILMLTAMNLLFIVFAVSYTVWKKKHFVATMQAYAPLLCDLLTRLAYWCFLEVTVCVLLALSVSYSTSQLVFACLVLAGILLGLGAFARLSCQKLRAPSPHERRSSIARALSCWEARLVKREVLPDVDPAPKTSGVSARTLARRAGQDRLRHLRSSLPQISRNKIDASKLILPENFEGGEEEVHGQKRSSEEMTELRTPRLGDLESARGLKSSQADVQFAPPSLASIKARQRRWAHNQAKRNLLFEDTVELSPWTRSLFVGLRLGDPYNAHLIEPAFYLLRRVFYALAIIMLSRHGLIAALLLQMTCVGQLCFSLSLGQWKDTQIHHQNVVNEVAIYLVFCFQLACAVSGLPPQQHAAGSLTVTFISLMLAFNLVVCAFSMFRQGKMFYLRSVQRKKLRKMIALRAQQQPQKTTQKTQARKARVVPVNHRVVVPSLNLSRMKRVSDLQNIVEESEEEEHVVIRNSMQMTELEHDSKLNHAARGSYIQTPMLSQSKAIRDSFFASTEHIEEGSEVVDQPARGPNFGNQFDMMAYDEKSGLQTMVQVSLKRSMGDAVSQIGADRSADVSFFVPDEQYSSSCPSAMDKTVKESLSVSAVGFDDKISIQSDSIDAGARNRIRNDLSKADSAPRQNHGDNLVIRDNHEDREGECRELDDLEDMQDNGLNQYLKSRRRNTVGTLPRKQSKIATERGRKNSDVTAVDLPKSVHEELGSNEQPETSVNSQPLGFENPIVQSPPLRGENRQNPADVSQRDQSVNITASQRSLLSKKSQFLKAGEKMLPSRLLNIFRKLPENTQLAEAEEHEKFKKLQDQLQASRETRSKLALRMPSLKSASSLQEEEDPSEVYGTRAISFKRAALEMLDVMSPSAGSGRNLREYCQSFDAQERTERVSMINSSLEEIHEQYMQVSHKRRQSTISNQVTSGLIGEDSRLNHSTKTGADRRSEYHAQGSMSGTVTFEDQLLTESRDGEKNSKRHLAVAGIRNITGLKQIVSATTVSQEDVEADGFSAKLQELGL